MTTIIFYKLLMETVYYLHLDKGLNRCLPFYYIVSFIFMPIPICT